MTAEEYIDEMNGHNSWQHYPPSKQKVIGWLKQFAEMQVEAINYNRCCTELKSKECPMCNEEKDCQGHNVCEDCGGRSF